MIKARFYYLIKDKKSFVDKVLPYIFGGGIFYKKIDAKTAFKQNRFSVIIETNTLSQLITASTGMLRYSADCVLEKIDILKTEKVISKSSKNLRILRPLLGIIIKPSLTYKPEIAKKLIKHAQKLKIDFIKDDDASEYSKQQVNNIRNLAKNVSYFQKIVEPKKLMGEFSMIVPWVDGWTLLQEMSKKSVTISHCAALSQQVSWYSHIIFSRLAGASLVIVPDYVFDNKLNLRLALEAASKDIAGVNSVRLIISGGINPGRIKSILPKIDKKYHKYIGFAAGSWLLSHSKDINKNLELLKNNLGLRILSRHGGTSNAYII